MAADPPESADVQGWTTSPQHRGTFNILLSCLTTILACTWSILYLNVPAVDDSLVKKIFRKAKWMIITILFPEFIFAHAMEERAMAIEALEKLSAAGLPTDLGNRKLSRVLSLIGNLEWKKLRSRYRRVIIDHSKTAGVTVTPSEDGLGAHGQLQELPAALTAEDRLPSTEQDARDDESREQSPYSQDASSVSKGKPYDWTLEHSILANMGGFRLCYVQGSTPKYYTIDGFYLAHLLQSGELKSLPNISTKEIKDKSKTDLFTQLVTILQLCSLILSFIARRTKNLPSSQLEVATLAFACCSILTYVAVRRKPKDVDVPIDIPILSDKRLRGYEYRHSLRANLPGEEMHPNSIKLRSFFIEVFVYRAWVPDAYTALIPKAAALNRRRNRRRGNPDPLGLASWLDYRRIRNDNYLVRDNRSHPMVGWMMIGTVVFGSVHCLAWDYHFPTRVERILWRSSSLTALVVPIALPLIDRGDNTIYRILNVSPRGGWWTLFATFWTFALPVSIMVVYVLSRLCILGLVFSSLRAMPEGVYQTTWSEYTLGVH